MGNENIFSVGRSVKFQLNESDEDCNQGSGKIKTIAGDIVGIVPENGCDLGEIHRVIVGSQLMLKKP